ncbi:MAG: hypothetical protein AAFZ80_09240 [Cyanobacteria bacterium P01_A01_bin.105]
MSKAFLRLTSSGLLTLSWVFTIGLVKPSLPKQLSLSGLTAITVTAYE